MSLTEIDRDLTRLEGELKQLETEYTMFFAGRLPKPPWDTRSRVDAAMKQMDRTPMRNTAHKFRFSTIQSRYAAFIDLWDRSLRAKEEGRTASSFAQASEPRQTGEARAHATRVLKVATVRGGGDDTTLGSLYASMQEARRAVGASEIPFEKFSKVVTSELERLRAAGTSGVTFRVTIKDGKAHLTAKPKRGTRTGAGAGKNDVEGKD